MKKTAKKTKKTKATTGSKRVKVAPKAKAPEGLPVTVAAPPPKPATAADVAQAMGMQPVAAPSALVALPPAAVEVTNTLKAVAAQAALLKVTDEVTSNTAMEMLTQVKAMTEKLETTRTNITKPLLESKKRIDALFKGPELQLEQVDKELRVKVLAYKDHVARTQAAERTKLLAAATDAQEKGDANAAANLALQAVEAPVPVKTAFVASGSVQSKKRWVWEVTDLAKVPLEYLSLDSTKVNSAVRAGTRNPGIPGINIFEKDELAVSSTGLPGGELNVG